MGAPLGLALSVDATASVGQPLGVRISVSNLSSSPVWMVGVVEGSELGVRYPHYRPTVEGPEAVAPPEIEYDMLAPLRPVDFRLLGPGEAFDPTDGRGEAAWHPIHAFSSLRPSVPGRYRLGLVLSTVSDDPTEWLGGWEAPGRDEVVARLAGMPRVTVEASASVEVNG